MHATSDPPACRHCGSADRRYTWQELANGTRHIRADCARCGRYVCYAPQTPGNRALADAGTSKTALLDLLVGLDERGIAVRRGRGGLRYDPVGLMTPELWALERQCRRHLEAMLPPCVEGR